MSIKETKTNLESKIAQARGLLQYLAEQTTTDDDTVLGQNPTESIKAFIDDLENRIRNLA